MNVAKSIVRRRAGWRSSRLTGKPGPVWWLAWGAEASFPSRAFMVLPALLTGGLSLLAGALAVIWLEIKTTKRELREDLKASEERQREEMRELRSDVKALGEKVDRLVESLVKVRQS